MPSPDFGSILNPPPARWPTKGDRLLVESENWRSGASFPDSDTARHIYIWDGFMQAGERLIESIGPTDFERDTLLYPILANYRHAVELGLKWLLTQYGPDLGVDMEAVETAGHNLWKLWKLLRPLMDVDGVPDKSSGTDAAEQLVKDLHDLDKSAMVLRYWRGKSHESFKLPGTRVDLANLRDVMKGLSNYLDGTDGYLDALASAQP